MAKRSSIIFTRPFLCAISPVRAVIVAFVLHLVVPIPYCHAEATIDTNLIIFHYHGPDTTSLLGSYISALGDINGDGYDDIAVSCNSPPGSFIFLGGAPIDTFPDAFYNHCFELRTGFDFTGDGVEDMICRSLNWDVYATDIIYLFRGYQDSISSIPYDSIMPDAASNRFGLYSKLGYVNTNGHPDLVTRQISTDGEWIKYYSDVFMIDQEVDWSYHVLSRRSISELTLIDFNGDNYLDICAGLTGPVDTVSYIYIFFGPDFASDPDRVIAPPIDQYSVRDYAFAYDIANIGDFNGDGWDDLGDIYVADTGGYFPLIYFCGPGADTLPDMAPKGEGRYIAGIGDINNDGYADLASGGSGAWEGMIYLFLGEPGGDPVPDEVVVSNDLPPFLLDDIGYRISPAGDFNGDGIDDFMFSCRNFFHGDPGDVFVVAGSEDIVVDIDSDAILPFFEDSELRQNYPNPFNSGTRIEFTLPRAGYATLTVYNVTGEVVSTPLQGHLSAGRHQIHWDGHDRYGNVVATGVYFYELTTESSRTGKKMILLK